MYCGVHEHRSRVGWWHCLHASWLHALGMAILVILSSAAAADFPESESEPEPAEFVAEFFRAFEPAIASPPAAGHPAWTAAVDETASTWSRSSASKGREAKRESMNALMYLRPVDTVFREVQRSSSTAVVVVEFSVGEHSARPDLKGSRFDGIEYVLQKSDGSWVITEVRGDPAPIKSKPKTRITTQQAPAAESPQTDATDIAVSTLPREDGRSSASESDTGPNLIASEASPGDDSPAELVFELSPSKLVAGKKSGRLSPELLTAEMEMNFVTLRGSNDLAQHVANESVCLEVPRAYSAINLRLRAADSWFALANKTVKYYLEFFPDTRCPTSGAAALQMGEEEGRGRGVWIIPSLTARSRSPDFQLGSCGSAAPGLCLDSLSGGTAVLRVISRDLGQSLKFGLRAVRLYRQTISLDQDSGPPDSGPEIEAIQGGE